MIKKAKSRSAGRKIIVIEFITLDGVMQAPGGSQEDTDEGFKYGGWVGNYFDEEAGKVMEKQMSLKQADLLLGHKTYDIFAGYWPEHAEDWPGINEVTKYVVSHTSTPKLKWENSELISGNIVQEIKKMKTKGNKNLQVWGSSDLVQTLFKHDLVDELWLKIFPITLGKGKKLFGNGTIPAAYKLTHSQITSAGVIVANYKRAGKVKTQDIGAD